MSFRASAAALKVAAPSASAKLVLVVLASYAGEEATCFPSQRRVAADAQLSLRTVRDAYRALEGAGLIETTPRRRPDGSRTTDLVRLTFPMPAAPIPAAEPAGRRRRPSPGGAAPGAGQEPVIEPEGGSEDPPTPRARDLTGDFERAWSAYPQAGKLTSSRRQGRAAWRAEAAAGGDSSAMAAAAGIYAADKGRWGRSGSPLSFHNFYALGRWIECAAPTIEPGPGRAAAAPGAGAPFEGPAALASALRARLGEAGFASWTAGARWRDEERTLVARTRLAASTLRNRCWSELRALGVAVADPAARP